MCSAIPCEAQGKYDQKEPSPESSSHRPSPSNKINVEDKKPTTGLDNAEAKMYEEFCVL